MNFLLALPYWEWILILGQVVLAFLLSSFIHPVLIYLSTIKNLNAKPVERSAHTASTSVLGGVGIFISFFITNLSAYLMYGNLPTPLIFLSLSVALFIMFFLGLKDDLMNISPLKKVIAQLVAAVIFLLISDNLVVSFGGIFGIYELPVWMSWIFTLFIYILGINAYNLIDGVNGLAGSLAALAMFYFGLSFMFIADYQWAFTCFSALGAILGFLKFNLFHKRKIFMGDNGSLLLGFLLVSISLQYLFSAESQRIGNLAENILTVVALFIHPIIDVARVFVVRLIRGQSPFSADKNHIHHFLLSLGLSHLKISLVVILFTILTTLLVTSIADYGFVVQLVVLIFIQLLAMLTPSFVSRNSNRIVFLLPWAKRD